jgi:hypothetical protein
MISFGKWAVSGSSDDCVEKDGTFYITKDATYSYMESSSARTRHKATARHNF